MLIPVCFAKPPRKSVSKPVIPTVPLAQRMASQRRLLNHKVFIKELQAKKRVEKEAPKRAPERKRRSVVTCRVSREPSVARSVVTRDRGAATRAVQVSAGPTKLSSSQRELRATCDISAGHTVLETAKKSSAEPISSATFHGPGYAERAAPQRNQLGIVSYSHAQSVPSFLAVKAMQNEIIPDIKSMRLRKLKRQRLQPLRVVTCRNKLQPIVINSSSLYLRSS